MKVLFNFAFSSSNLCFTFNTNYNRHQNNIVFKRDIIGDFNVFIQGVDITDTFYFRIKYRKC